MKTFIKDYMNTFYEFYPSSTEDFFIVKLIQKYMKGKRILDLGSGATSPIMSHILLEAEELIAVGYFGVTMPAISEQRVPL